MATHIFSILRLISEEAAFGPPFILILGIERLANFFLSHSLFSCFQKLSHLINGTDHPRIIFQFSRLDFANGFIF